LVFGAKAAKDDVRQQMRGSRSDASKMKNGGAMPAFSRASPHGSSVLQD